MKQRIIIISSSRADYGILKNLIYKMQIDKSFDMKFVVTGSHLDAKYGNTLKYIYKDKIKIDQKIKIHLGKTTKKNITNNLSKYINKFSNYFDNIKPNAILILGDRYEMLAIAIVANIHNIPIVHLHGGEITEGSYDDQNRHAITKLSFIHFVSTLSAKKRVMQMGENKNNVFHIGSLGVENLINYKKNNSLRKIFNFKLKTKKILVSYHSVTNNIKSSRLDFSNLLKSLKFFQDCTIIFTSPNHDLDSDFITKKINNFLKKNSNAKIIKSLGQENFYECLKSFDCIIGNSSSGIIEAASARIPSINIGDRQIGREKPESIYSIKGDSVLIKKTIEKVFSLKQKNLIRYFNPYYKKNSSDLIISELKKINFVKVLPKKFKDNFK